MSPPPLLNCRAVVLDLDGTLVNTMGDFVVVLDLCLRAMGLTPLPAGQVRALVGKGSEHLIRSVLTQRVPHWPLLKTCEALGTTPHETLMVGDSSNDAQAARAAGCPVALLTYGYNHGHPVQDSQPDWVLGSLVDLCR